MSTSAKRYGTEQINILIGTIHSLMWKAVVW